MIHVTDCEIVPVATYAIQATGDGTNFIAATQLATTGKPGAGKHYGDVTGARVGDVYPPPDGMVNMHDVMAMVTAFNTPASGPERTWVDVHGNGEGNPPNGLVNVSDLMTVVLATNGGEYRNTVYHLDPGECPVTTGVEPIMLPGDPIALTLAGSEEFLDPEEWLYVDVFTAAADELGAYEVALEVGGGTSGTLVLADIVVDDERGDFVFGGDATIIAKNVGEGRVGVLRESGGMEVEGTKYLATFVYQPASGASGVFEIALRGDGASFLNDGNGGLLPIAPGSAEVVGVGIDCWETWHCNDNNPCTGDACVDGACVFTNLAQGTPCNDGYFCTATDACDGSGLCVGTGNPCERHQWCNEFQDQCQESPPEM